MSVRRQSQLTIGFSPVWLRQSAWNTPIPGASLTAAFPATSKNYLDVDETVEEVFDCTGEDFLFEFITKRLARLTIDFDVDPDVLAGVTAFAFGVSSSASGGTNAVQTEVITATGGLRRLRVTKGADTQITGDLAYNASGATITTALNALSNVAPGDIVVDATDPAAITYTFAQAFALQVVDLIGVDTWQLTGGTSAFTMTTPGVGQTYTLSRITGYTLPLMTLYIGFRGSSIQPLIFKNVVVDSIRVRSTSGNKVTATATLVGSGSLAEASAYTMPACMDIVPIRFGDCQINILGQDYIAANLGREFEFQFNNNVVPQFDGAGIDSTRAERASIRPCNFNLFVLGEPGETLDLQAAARTSGPVSIRVGPVGRYVRYEASQALIKRAATPIRFSGDPVESELAIVGRPKKVSGISATPIQAVCATSQASAYLTSA